MRTLLSLFILVGLAAPASALTFAESASRSHKNYVNGGLGMGQGGFGFRGAYEYTYHRTYSIGGLIHIEPKDEDVAAPAVTAIHAFMRPHFFQRTFDFYLSPGFGLAIVDSGAKDETVIGPSLAIGILYQLNEEMALGVENLKLYSWTGSDFKGVLSDTLFANFKYGF
ncbi:MAG: hypothetical protein CL677_05425 [Bdellovibrionaceae bacterium]|nr:hypothetical protein [Pseudobdellovibrionaceae bacterium]|tara:strand:- start:25679 stop:26182 length:504 start_codon:yes stop_codon:yes gene_type:complete